MSRRYQVRWPVVAILTALWLLMWGDLTPLLVLSGVLVAVAVVLVFPFPPAMWEGVLRPWPFLVLLGRFAFDLVTASLQVAWLAVRPRPLGPSAVVAVDLHSRSELLLTLTSELISLVPGSVLVEIDEAAGRIWLHVLDGTRDPEDVRAEALAQERRVIAALGSRAERDRWCTRQEGAV